LQKRFVAEPLQVWAVRVWEEQTPAGAEPLEGILVTSVSTTTLKQAWERAGWYERRWVVQDYLKSPQKWMPSPASARRRPLPG
jgi:hypothetical protein